MTELLHIPFEPGMYDDTDPVIGGGRLAIAENVRFHKLGRAEKRYGTQTMAAGGNGALGMLAEFNGHKVFSSMAQFRYAQGRTASPFALSSLTFGILAPDRAEPVARTDRGTSVGNQDCATANGITVFAWDDGVSVYYAVKTSDNSLATTVTLAAGVQPRCVAVGDTIWIIWSDFILNLRGFSYNTLTGATSGPTSIVPIHASRVMDVASYSSTQYLIAYHSGAGAITTALMTGTTVADSVAMGTGSGEPYSVGVYSGPTTAVITAWGTSSGSAVGIYFRAFDENLTPTCSETAVTTVNQGIAAQVCPFREDSGAYLLVWTQFTGGSSSSYLIRRATIAINGAVTAGIMGALHFTLASKPFTVDRATCVWASSDGFQSGWDLQRNLFVLDLTSTTVAEPAVLLHDAPSLGTVSDLTHVPNVVQRNDGKWCYPAARITREKSGSLSWDCRGLDALYFVSAGSAIVNAHRDAERAQNALYIAGGILNEYTSPIYEAGFFRYPVVTASTATATGGSILAGTYQYAWVYEQFDPAGRVCRSAPSDPITITFASGTSNKVVFEVTTYGIGRGYLGALTAGDQVSPVMAHLYRTQDAGTTLYRVTKNTAGVASGVAGASGAPMAWGGVSGPTFQYTDGIADDPGGANDISANQPLYTEGGVLANVLAPACRFLTEGGGRLWLGGLFNRTEVVCSKLLVPSEPAQFTGDPAFSLFFPDDVTGIVWGDGALVGFTSDAIYLVNGDGPDDQGSGEFTNPERLPSDVGCIAWQSIVEIPSGWLFQSRRGIYILPRGFGPPQFIGAAVQDTLKNFPIVLSAVRVVEPGNGTLGESTVRFVVSSAAGDSRVLVLNINTLRWESSDNYGEPLSNAGMWDNRFTYGVSGLDNGVGIRQETYTGFSDRGNYIRQRQKTGDLRPFGQLGSGKISKVQIMGEIRTPALLNCVVSFDGASGINLLGASGTVVSKSGYPGARFYQQFNLPNHHCNSIDIDVWDSAPSPTGMPGQGLAIHGVTIEHEASPGMPRLAAKDSA